MIRTCSAHCLAAITTRIEGTLTIEKLAVTSGDYR
jgi:hypothetical protein